jgi:hypothetical protein
MVQLLMDLAQLECRIAALALAAGLDLESAVAQSRAVYYLQLRASEANDRQRPVEERRKRFRAWLRGAD